MRNKYLLSLLAALGFSGCGNNNEIWDEPCYYGPGPDWTPDIIISSQKPIGTGDPCRQRLAKEMHFPLGKTGYLDE